MPPDPPACGPGPAGAPAGLPFFVYGTLRPGGRNHPAHLAGRITAVRPALLPGAALHAGPGFPYALPDRDRHVFGDLVTVRPDLYPAVLLALDRLEDCRPDGSGEYVRHRLPVRLTDTGAAVVAWVYLAGPGAAARLRARPAPIPSGDWTRRGG
ncbi:gamma-glutamylcyclotransferase family protein [Kitasatospora sp. NBC_00315]|uniref:gamma-glutamylcyclotransferase family protein n=1 Tax=Kitasatospora sp. NBC_00315 TaxID=2975963 RepID=UPI00324924BD